MARTLSGRDSFRESGQTRLLELGYPQGLPRLLPWPYNTAICFCVLSSVSNLTGTLAAALPVTLLAGLLIDNLLSCSALFTCSGWWWTRYFDMELDLVLYLHNSDCPFSERNLLSTAQFW